MTICGTDEYMAPEMLFNESFSYPADMFSFGELQDLLYECQHWSAFVVGGLANVVLANVVPIAFKAGRSIPMDFSSALPQGRTNDPSIADNLVHAYPRPCS